MASSDLTSSHMVPPLRELPLSTVPWAKNQVFNPWASGEYSGPKQHGAAWKGSSGNSTE